MDFIELKIGFRLKSDFREKEFMFLNRESLDQVSNSKVSFCLVFVLDFLMAETAAREHSRFGREKEVQPADEVGEGPVPKAGSQVPPAVKADAPELTESPPTGGRNDSSTYDSQNGDGCLGGGDQGSFQFYGK